MKSNYKQLGPYIRQVDIRNTEGKEDNLLPISTISPFCGRPHRPCVMMRMAI